MDTQDNIKQLEQLPCINFSLRKAVRVLNRIYDQYLAEAGLTGGQFSILYVVHELDVATNKKLQSILVLDQTTLTRNLKPLLREGYLSSVPSVTDRRQKNLSLTPEGRVKFLEAKEQWFKAQQKIYKELGPELSEQLISLSDSVVKLD
ncbi:MarR family winged helix-turn-helix transcriptional regulator [Neptuniibacter sp. QD48_11]|uniref:MarR family winged helix-turn-helix transcriptional regulator n=1 Tax=unclassified Neptuniibacter TaxID=2630693 RepID=UPI0039F51EC0